LPLPQFLQLSAVRIQPRERTNAGQQERAVVATGMWVVREMEIYTVMVIIMAAVSVSARIIITVNGKANPMSYAAVHKNHANAWIVLAKLVMQMNTYAKVRICVELARAKTGCFTIIHA